MFNELGFRALAFIWVTFFHVIAFSDLNLINVEPLIHWRAFHPFAVFIYAGIKVKLYSTEPNSGGLGVEVFFILAGLLLERSLHQQLVRNSGINVFRTISGRFVRLVPVILLAELLPHQR